MEHQTRRKSKPGLRRKTPPRPTLGLPSGTISASPDAELALGHRLHLARARPRLPAPPRTPQTTTLLTVAHVRKDSTILGKTFASFELGFDLDTCMKGHPHVIQHRDADASHKLTFTHTEVLLQPLRYPLPQGLERMANPSALVSALSRKTTDSIQQHSTRSCRPQDTKTSLLLARRPPGSTTYIPRCINRAIMTPPRGRGKKHLVTFSCLSVSALASISSRDLETSPLPLCL
jgi:hypothetical protein